MGTCSSFTWPDNLSEKLIKELAQGKESATKLQTLLHKPFGQLGSVSAQELAGKILTSFSETISALTSISDDNQHRAQDVSDHDRQSSETIMINGGPDVISQINPREPLDHDDRSSEDSGESSKKITPGFKDRRGCYKRRKNSQSWSTVRTTIEDGQAWRKYGQKEILNAEYPRGYFRCTRKYDQGCKATKQVQQIKDNPKMYQITYIGQHTCKHFLKAPQMIVDSQPHHSESVDHKFGFDHPRKNGTIVSNKYSKSEGDQVAVRLKEEIQISEDVSEDKSSFDTVDLWSSFKGIELPDTTTGLFSSNNKIMRSESDQDVEDSITFSFVDQTNEVSFISLENMDDFEVKSIDFCNSDFCFNESDFPIGSA